MAEQAQVALQMCFEHPDEEPDLYCKTCKRSICNECMKSEHLGHDFDTIAKYFRKITNKRKDIILEIEREINRKHKLNRRCLREIKRRNKNVLKMNLENIEAKRKEIREVHKKNTEHEAVDNILKEYMDSLKVHNKEVAGRIKEEKEIFRRDQANLILKLEMFKSTAMVGLDFIEYYEELKSKSDNVMAIDVTKHFNRKLYEEGDLTSNVPQTMAGKIKELGTRVLETEQTSSFRHGEAIVHTVCPIKSYMAWITLALAHVQEFTLLRSNGHHIKSVPNYTGTHSFVLCDNDILVCNVAENNIMKIDLSGEKTIWMDVSPFIARFIGNALNGNVLVALHDKESVFRTCKSQTRVQMMSPSGIVVYQYEHDEDGITPVFTWPTRMTQNYNCVPLICARWQRVKIVAK